MGKRLHDLLLCSILALLVACSPADLIKPFTGGGPEVTAQIGKENESNKVKVETKTEETINAQEVNITESVPWYVWGLAFSGWFIASPQSLYRQWKQRNKE